MSMYEFNSIIDLNDLVTKIMNSDIAQSGIESAIDEAMSDISDHVDLDDLADKVLENISMSDLADSVFEQFDISDIAQNVLDDISLDSEVTSIIDNLLDTYDPYNACRTGRLANDAIADGMVFALEENDKVIEAFKKFVLSITNPVIEVPVTVAEIEPFKYTDASNNPDFIMNKVTLNNIVRDVISFVGNIATPIGGREDTLASVWTQSMIDRYNLNNKKEG